MGDWILKVSVSIKIISGTHTNLSSIWFSNSTQNDALPCTVCPYLSRRPHFQMLAYSAWQLQIWLKCRDGWRCSRSPWTSIQLNSRNRYDSYRASCFARGLVASFANVKCFAPRARAKCISMTTMFVHAALPVLTNLERLQSASFVPSRLGHGL